MNTCLYYKKYHPLPLKKMNKTRGTRWSLPQYTCSLNQWMTYVYSVKLVVKKALILPLQDRKKKWLQVFLLGFLHSVIMLCCYTNWHFICNVWKRWLGHCRSGRLQELMFTLVATKSFLIRTKNGWCLEFFLHRVYGKPSIHSLQCLLYPWIHLNIVRLNGSLLHAEIMVNYASACLEQPVCACIPKQNRMWWRILFRKKRNGLVASIQPGKV